MRYAPRCVNNQNKKKSSFQSWYNFLAFHIKDIIYIESFYSIFHYMWFCLFVNIKNREQTKMCSSSSIIDKIYSVIRFNQGRIYIYIYVSVLTYHKKGGDMEGF